MRRTRRVACASEFKFIAGAVSGRDLMLFAGSIQRFFPAFMSSSQFFIAGCQRSGTTLMRLVLECHPDIECFDEVDSYRILASPRDQPNSFKRLRGFKIPRWTEQLGSSGLWDYGLPERASQFYAGQKIIFMVRDVKDSIASMLKLRAGNVSWLEMWGEPIIAAKVEKDPVFARRYSRELRLRDHSKHHQIASGALYWKYKNDALFDLLGSACPVLPVRYETLVSAPQPVLQGVCAFLGINWESALLEHPRFVHRELFENGLTLGNTNPNRPIDAASVDQWRAFIPYDAVPDVEAIAGNLQRRIFATCLDPEPALTAL